jgi:plasmid stabilization system protein ParE
MARAYLPGLLAWRAATTHVHPPTGKEQTMPRAWSDKRERQYRHIRDSYRDEGVSKDEAEERAARTVNARREAGGETKQRSSDSPTKDELYAQAKRFNITGRSKMDKEQLENAIAGHRGGTSTKRRDV